MEIVLRAQGLSRRYPIPRQWFKPRQYIQALTDVSLELHAGETFAIVGESGCGKSTLARTLAMLERPDSGQLEIAGKNALHTTRRTQKPLRSQVQMVFQNPYASLNPRRLIGAQLAEPLRLNTPLNRHEREEQVARMLERVGLRAEYAQRYPHMFSGGQRQRIAIARAMMLKPKILIADEPTSALDVSVQAQILNLFSELQQEYATSYIFISHNLNVVRHIADQIAVMHHGQIVEHGPGEQLFQQPQHPYTQALLNATPRLGGSLA